MPADSSGMQDAEAAEQMVLLHKKTNWPGKVLCTTAFVVPLVIGAILLIQHVDQPSKPRELKLDTNLENRTLQGDDVQVFYKRVDEGIMNHTLRLHVNQSEASNSTDETLTLEIFNMSRTEPTKEAREDESGMTGYDLVIQLDEPMQIGNLTNVSHIRCNSAAKMCTWTNAALNENDGRRLWWWAVWWGWKGYTVYATVSRRRRSGGCFPADAVVRCLPSATKTIDQVRVGDRCLTPSGEYEDIYLSSHAESRTEGDFVQVTAESGHQVELTALHYIQVNDTVMLAKDISVGMMVTVWNEQGASSSPVQQKTIVRKKGLYNPHTTSGSLLVNNVSVSTWSDWFLEDAKIDPQSAIGIYQVILAPVRVLYYFFPAWVQRFCDAFNDRPSIAEASLLDIVSKAFATNPIFWDSQKLH